ncbi:MAG: HEAT repeat domain-containing protein [Armatimonadetes bacterium]|nr:HEAT repeat domain-containing protein [Armatimonadota bacterium]MDW8027660.1 HEAT repeat domain-containing protein [Armatimonadota bacterium]
MKGSQWANAFFALVIGFVLGLLIGIRFSSGRNFVVRSAFERLKSADPVQRIEAAWDLAMNPNREAVNELANLLLDREDHVRLAAAVALARIGELAILPTINVVKKAAEESAKNPQQPFHFLPGQFFRHPRDAAIFILTNIARSSEGAKKVAKLLESKDPLEVGIAQQSLQQVGASALPSILPYLRHGRREVRFAALSVISAYGDKAIDSLRKFVVENKEEPKTLLDQETKQMAVYALGNTQSDRALPILKEALKDPLLETAAWQAIGNLRTDGAKKFLLEQVKRFFKEGKNPSPALISAIGSCQLAEAIPYLRQWLRSTDPRVQESAAMALGMLRDKDSLPVLISLLPAKDVGLASAAANALAMLADSRALPALYKTLERVNNPADTQVVLNALTAIQSINERSSIPVLEDFMAKHKLPEIVQEQAKRVLEYLQRYGRP